MEFGTTTMESMGIKDQLYRFNYPSKPKFEYLPPYQLPSNLQPAISSYIRYEPIMPQMEPPKP